MVESPGTGPGTSGGRARLWEVLGELGEALGELWEGLEELWDSPERLNSHTILSKELSSEVINSSVALE